MDSVLKAHKIALKNVKNITSSITEVVLKDTLWLKPDTVYVQVDGTYNLPISFKDSCFKMKGYMISRDPDSQFKLTELQARASSVHILHRDKWKWYKPFKTRNYKLLTTNNCGETTIVSIEVSKN